VAADAGGDGHSGGLRFRVGRPRRRSHSFRAGAAARELCTPPAPGDLVAADVQPLQWEEELVREVLRSRYSNGVPQAPCRGSGRGRPFSSRELCVRSLRVTATQLRMRLQPDGRYIVSASQDYTLKIWDANTGREIRTLPGDAFAWDCAISPNGRLIVWRTGTRSQALGLRDRP